MNIGVIGAGYWGPNLIRNFSQIQDCNMKTCCDLDQKKLDRIKSLFPEIHTSQQIDDILNDPTIEGVAIATPVYTHFDLAKKCLVNGKSVLIEKPFASSSQQCRELIELAEKQQKILMVGHTFEYTASVNKIKEILDSGELGLIHYISCQRLNLGLFQSDINVIWDLAPHDVSIILYLLNEFPESVNAQGMAHYKEGIEDVAVMTLNFSCGAIAFIHNSWLDPDKIRKITIVGSKKMLVYDDINAGEKIRIYDKGVEAPPYYDTFAEFHFSYRYGDIYIPRVQEHEPLRYECSHFLESIRKKQAPRSDGYSGLRVISILEAANKSLANGGAKQPVSLDI